MEPWMTLALEQAKLAGQAGEVPVGAVVVCAGQVIAAAHNRRQELHDPTAHAELLCLRQAAERIGDWRLRDCTLYVTLEPCPMCAGAMVMSQLGKCVFGAADPEKGCCGSVYDLPGDAKLGGITAWQGGVMEKECQALLRSFFGARR